MMWLAGVGLLRRASMIRANPIKTALIGLRSFTVEPETNENSNKKKEMVKLLSFVNVEELKKRLLETTGDKETIPYNTLLEATQRTGIATSLEEARAFARVLNDAGLILLFRDKVYFRPGKVVEQIRRSATDTVALNVEDKEEFNQLKAKKEEIDILAHRHVRRILWCGLAYFSFQIGLFFRLTYYEFSWDVTGPITFFVAASEIFIGYAYFLLSSRDPSYQNFMKTLFLSKQKKLFKKYSFDIQRFQELGGKC